MVNIVDRECVDALAEKFYRNAGFGLGKGNGYEQTILQPRLEELEEKVKDTYPEYYSAYANVKEAFITRFRALYSEEKKTAGGSTKENSAAVQAK